MPSDLSALPPKSTDHPAALAVARVVIAEQNRTYAEAFSLVCREIFPGAQIEVFCHGHDCLAFLQRQFTDVLLLGLTFADMDGIDLLNQVTQEHLAAHTLIISERWEEHILLSLRTARIDGAVDTATEPIEAIKQALLLIAQGRGYISTTLRRYLIDELPDHLSAQELTMAELRVLRVIGHGCDNQEASGQLQLSSATVQTHRRNIMRKLKVSTSAKLVREAVRLGVVRIPPASLFKRPQLALFPRHQDRQAEAVAHEA